MNYEKKFFQMELAVKVLTGELELGQTEYRRHDQPNEEWKTCVLGPKEWNFDLVEYRIKPDELDEKSPRCLCQNCCGNDTRPCVNAERERDWQWVIEKLNKRIDATEAKLAIAIEALEECRRFCNEFDYEPTYNDIENIDKALAKLKE